MSDYKELLEKLDEAHVEEKKFRLETFGVRDYDPDESTLHSEAAEALRELLPPEPERLFKLGDKVQEITDDTEQPWGYIIEERELGQFVKLENTKHAGRKLLYYDDEIEPFAEPSKFVRGAKVRELVNGNVGTVLLEVNGSYEVIFQKNYGTVGLTFGPDMLEAAE